MQSADRVSSYGAVTLPLFAAFVWTKCNYNWYAITLMITATNKHHNLKCMPLDSPSIQLYSIPGNRWHFFYGELRIYLSNLKPESVWIACMCWGITLKIAGGRNALGVFNFRKLNLLSNLFSVLLVSVETIECNFYYVVLSSSFPTGKFMRDDV